MKINYFLIPLFTVIVAFSGSMFTNSSINSWYQTLTLPAWTPPGWVIGIVWNIIFVLSTICALRVWNKAPHNGRFWTIITLFIINGILNVFWSYLFFSKHLLTAATWEAGILSLSVILLIILIRPLLPKTALLLMPYAGWTAFATYVTYVISQLNS